MSDRELHELRNAMGNALAKAMTSASVGDLFAHRSGSKITQENPVKTYANPPKECDICLEPVGEVMYDAKTKMGPWANMCQRCWRRNTSGRLGTGLGQKYEMVDGRFVKTEG